MPAEMPEPTARDRQVVYRILDANLNRASEGLRVVEEYLRFAVEDVHLAGLCKRLRHDLLATVRRELAERLPGARDVRGDVGTAISTQQEYRRADLTDVVAANLKRVEQSLRSMEEYVKVALPQLASHFESLRYDVYTLERSILGLRKARQRLAAARLYVLIDGRSSLDEFRELVTVLVASRVDVLQLRDKDLTDRDLLGRAVVLRELTREHDVVFIVNDRVDLALAARADGVHLGQEELPVAEARRIIGPDLLIGVSTHRIEQARQAVLDGADYLGCGPTFPSSTKSFEQFPGVAYLKQVSSEIALPAFAIGGVDYSNVEAVCQAGFSRVAVSHSVIAAADPAAAARRLAGILNDRARLCGASALKSENRNPKASKAHEPNKNR
jgi:thiamine-phosphate pyrophosphorylase